MKRKTILFDINETVLSLRSLRPRFKEAFDDERLTDTWFSMLLHMSTVSVVTDVSTDFASLAKISLETLVARTGVQPSNKALEGILASFANLTAHDDIKPALQKLKTAGFPVVALSNSSLTLMTKQIENAGLDDYFDELISVQEGATFKPSPTAYTLASRRLGRAGNELRLVAAHDWDTHGALCAGLNAAYINRSGAPYNPLYKKPQICASTMHELVDLIIAADS